MVYYKYYLIQYNLLVKDNNIFHSRFLLLLREMLFDVLEKKKYQMKCLQKY